MVLIDATYVKIHNGQIANRFTYLAPAAVAESAREIAGTAAGGGGEGTESCLRVLAELKHQIMTSLCPTARDEPGGELLPFEDLMDITWLRQC
ncbi:transposase [Nocardia sp. bgisy118]|uniref:transposase n=1 Tax=Nocardia sp. bgisy118 TaxID=3413786 RepID=UPI003F49F775